MPIAYHTVNKQACETRNYAPAEVVVDKPTEGAAKPCTQPK
jgi:hypothetical protein